MSRRIRGRPDGAVRQLAEEFKDFERDHPRARIDLHRRNPAVIRIRIIDPDFEGMDRVQRDDLVWSYLDRMRSEAKGDITMLLLLTPAEAPLSPANLEFENLAHSHSP
jgi:hypothetical protein